MMMSVISRPPDDSSLSRALREDCKQERKNARGFVAAMREVSMIACCDAKHTYKVQCYAADDRFNCDTKPQGADESREVHTPKASLAEQW